MPIMRDHLLSSPTHHPSFARCNHSLCFYALFSIHLLSHQSVASSCNWRTRLQLLSRTVVKWNNPAHLSRTANMYWYLVVCGRWLWLFIVCRQQPSPSFGFPAASAELAQCHVYRDATLPSSPVVHSCRLTATVIVSFICGQWVEWKFDYRLLTSSYTFDY